MSRYQAQILLIVLCVSCSPESSVPEPPPPPVKKPLTIFRTDSVMVEMGKRHTLLFDALQRKDWKMSGEQLARIQNSAQSIASNTPLKPLALEFIEQTRYLQRVIETGKKHESKKAFSQLTEGCNHCHVGANMGFAVVRIPDEKTDN